MALFAIACASCRENRIASRRGLDAGHGIVDAARALDTAASVHVEMPAPPPLSPPLADAAASRDAAPSGPPLPRSYPRLLRGLADGTIPFGRVLDSDRGVTFIDYLEAEPRPHSRSRIASRQLCGASLAPDGELHGHIVAMVRQAAELEMTIECAHGDCTVGSFEYGIFYHVRFEPRPGGDPLLVALWRTSEATMGDEWLAPMSRYVHTHLAAPARCESAGAPTP